MQHLVMQNGGASHEWYPHFFDDAETANEYIEDAAKASYECLGPFAVQMTPDEEIVAAARRLVEHVPHLKILEEQE